MFLFLTSVCQSHMITKLGKIQATRAVILFSLLETLMRDSNIESRLAMVQN